MDGSYSIGIGDRGAKRREFDLFITKLQHNVIWYDWLRENWRSTRITTSCDTWKGMASILNLYLIKFFYAEGFCNNSKFMVHKKFNLSEISSQLFPPTLIYLLSVLLNLRLIPEWEHVLHTLLMCAKHGVLWGLLNWKDLPPIIVIIMCGYLAILYFIVRTSS